MNTTGRGTCAEARIVDSLKRRFWAKVAKSDGCWEWTAEIGYKGYGRFCLWSLGKRSTVAAHRVAWELTSGPIPVGLMVCHRCDNRKCVRPDHLFLGTNQDNMTDMKNKGRSRGASLVGESNPASRLTAEIVRTIRAEHSGQVGDNRALAKKYDVSHKTISKIVLRQRWAHV